MLSLVQGQAESLTARAREELAFLERGSEDKLVDSEDGEESHELERQEIASMMERLKVPAGKDAKSEEYEIKPGDLDPAVKSADVVPTERTASVVRQELSRVLRELVDKSAREMEEYDKHCVTVIDHYKEMLERRTGKPAAPPRSILKRTGSEQSPLSPENRRASAGQSFANAGAAPPVRTYESIEEVARRGSK